MRKTLIIGGAVLGLGALGAAFDPPPAARPDAAPAAAAAPAAPRPSDKERAQLCEPFGNVAATAWELAQRGIAERVALNAATAQVREPALLPLVRDAVGMGYATRTQEGARQRAFSTCMAGLLGR